MKEEFRQYLINLGMTQPLIDRADELLGVYSRITRIEIEDIYISEYIKRGGRREYEDLRIFSSNFYALIQNFLNENAIILANYKSISRVVINRDNYDFSEANTNSKLTIKCSFFASESTMTIKGTGLNCDNLNQIFQKYVKPFIMALA